MVGEVSGRAKAESINLSVAVDEGNRLELCSKQLQRALERMHLDLRQAAEFIVRIKNVAEHVADEFSRIRMRIKRQPIGLVTKTYWTKIVDAQDMVGVGMSVKDGVKRANIFANCLFAKVWRGVDQHAAPGVFDQDRRAGSPVARVAGVTDGAVAANRRHAHRRTAAQHGECSIHFAAETCSGPRAIALVTST